MFGNKIMFPCGNVGGRKVKLNLIEWSEELQASTNAAAHEEQFFSCGKFNEMNVFYDSLLRHCKINKSCCGWFLKKLRCARHDTLQEKESRWGMEWKNEKMVNANCFEKYQFAFRWSSDFVLETEGII